MSIALQRPSLSTSRGTLDGSSQIPTSAAGGGSLRTKTPSIFQDMSSLEIPSTLQGAFKWCKHLANWSAVHRAYVEAMSNLPVTDLLIKTRYDVSDVVRNAREILGIGEPKIESLVHQHWRLPNLAKQAFRSIATYSNAVVIASYPFEKKLRCDNCDGVSNARSTEWTIRGTKFQLECPHCRTKSEASQFDEDLDIAEKVRFTTLDMELIDTKHNPITGSIYVYYTIPDALCDLIRNGDKDIISDTPKNILEAVWESEDYRTSGNKLGKVDTAPRVKLQEGSYYLINKPSLPMSETQGLCFPLFAATFKDYWLYLTFRKAQEAIANGWIVPRRFLYPEASGTSGNLFEMLNVSEYMGTLRKEISKHQQDPNYQSVIPFPVGQLNLGGDAKGLMLSSELRILIESMCATLQSPLEFLYGGMSFSASSVPAKKMQVQIEGDRIEVLAMLQWAADHVCKSMHLPQTVLEFSSFRLADDLQHAQMMFSLQQSKLVSSKRLHEELGLDSESEVEAIKKDVMIAAEIRKIEANSDAEIERLFGAQPAIAQSEGNLQSLLTHIKGLSELRKEIEKDSDLMSVLQNHPDLYQQVMGMGGEAKPTPEGATFAAPDPNKVAPLASQENTAAIEGVSPEIITDLLGVVLSYPEGPPREQALQDIEAQWGGDVTRQIRSSMIQTDMYANVPADDRPPMT